MQTLDPSSWEALCKQQQARAMAGDQQAAKWCAEHRPAVDAATDAEADSAVRQLTRDELSALCLAYDDGWGKVCAAVARLFRGDGTRADLRDLLFHIGSIGNWQRELTRQYYDNAPECSGNPETRAAREREFDALLARLSEGTE